MQNKNKILNIIIFVIICAGLCFELLRDIFKTGDFIGYVNTGNLVLNNKNIYSDPLNTWPPFFSILCTLLTLGNNLSNVLIRFIWLSTTLLAMYYIMKFSTKILYNKSIGFKENENKIALTNSLILIPLLIILRFLLDNMSNIQINIFMLLLAFLCFMLFIQNKNILAAFFLAFSISIKVYTIFLVFYFLFKREFKILIWTIIFLFILNSSCILVFGFENTIIYYKYWLNKIALIPQTIHHKNQSLLGLMLRLLNADDPGKNFYINITNINKKTIKYITYILILLIFFYLFLIFRKKIINKKTLGSLLEYSVMFNIIPLFSPLAWKAYFIFLWFPYFLCFNLLFIIKSKLARQKMRILKLLFFFSIILNIFSTEGIIGPYLSDILETCSCITIGSFILVLIQIVLYKNKEKFMIFYKKY